MAISGIEHELKRLLRKKTLAMTGCRGFLRLIKASEASETSEACNIASAGMTMAKEMKIAGGHIFYRESGANKTKKHRLSRANDRSSHFRGCQNCEKKS